MATGGGETATYGYEMELPVSVTVKTRALTEGAIRCLHTKLLTEIVDLRIQLQKKLKLQLVNIANIALKKNKLILVALFTSKQQVEDFYKVAKATKKGSMVNKLSKFFTDFGKQFGLDFSASVPYSEKLLFEVIMPDKQYHKAMLAFADDEDEDDTDEDEKGGSDSVVRPQAPPAPSEDALKGAGDCLSSERPNGEAEVKIETEAMDMVQGNVGEVSTPDSRSEGKSDTECRTKDMPNTEKPVGLQGTTVDSCLRVRKEIIIYSPATHMEMRSEDCRQFNQRMKLRNALWVSVVFIDALELSKPIFLSFHCTVQERTLVPFVYTSRPYSSDKVPLGKMVTQREIWPDDATGVYCHLYDIFLGASCKDVKDMVMEIESLRKFSLDLKKVDEVTEALFKDVSMYSEKHVLLFLVTLDVLYRRVVLQYHLKIAKKDVRNMIRTVSTKCNLADLPSSCDEYIPYVCEQLFCYCYNKSDICFVTFISAMYPFLKAKYFNKRIEKAVGRKLRTDMAVCVSTDECSRKAVELCASLFEKGTSNTDDDNGEIDLLCRISRHLSFRTLSDVYTEIQLNESQNPSKKINTVLENLRSTLKPTVARDARKAREANVDGLLEMWQLLHKNEELWYLCRDILIKELLLFLKHPTGAVHSKTEETVEQMCRSWGMHGDTDSQLQMLEQLAESHNKRLHGLFLKLLDSEEFSTVSNHVESKMFCKWFETAKKHCGDPVYRGTEVAELPSLYAYLCQVLRLPIVFDSDQIQQDLKAAMLKHLKGLPIKDVLQQSDKIEEASPKHCATTTSELYCMDIQQILRTKYGQQPQEALLDLCGTNRMLRINTRTTASIACAIVDVHEVDCKEETYAAVETICGKAKFWTTVLTAEGTLKGKLLVDNKTVQYVQHCLKEFVKLLEKEDVKCGFLEGLSEHGLVDQVVTLLTTTGKAKTRLDKLWSEAENAIKSERQQIRIVKTVLNAVKIEMSDHNCLPKGFESVEQHMLEMEQTLHSPWLSVSNLKKAKLEWVSLQSLPEYCRALESYIASKLFWNVCFKNDIFEDVIGTERSQHVVDEDGEFLRSIRYLFQTDEDHNMEKEPLYAGPTVSHLEALAKKGTHMYRSTWLSLQDNECIMFADVLDFLKGVCIGHEFNMAEKQHSIAVSASAKETLTQLFEMHEYRNRVDAMVSALDTFGMRKSKNSNTFWESVSSFQTIVENEDYTAYTFGEIKEALAMICGVAEQLREEDVAIMQMFVQSSQLVAFMKEVLNEDIRNLIDAVEEVSEQHVSESTVSSLIDVKSFLQPLLKFSFDSEEKESAFIKLICQQSRLFPKGISGKMEDCMHNLHNLKSLYNNVANRGERTREIVANILKKSSVHFHLTETKLVDFWISYKQSKKTTVKHTKQTLVDIRSRALLLMNTESRGKGARSDDMEVFVKYIDLCMEIEEICFELYASGHLDYTKLDILEEPKTLHKLKERVFTELETWMDVLQNCRRTHYLMRFVYGSQIHTLNDFLTKGCDVENVLPILTFINRSVTIETFESILDELTLNLTATYEKQLDDMGKFLQQVCGMQASCQRALKLSDDESQVGSFVQEGKLFVAGLKKNSSLVVNTLLAIYNNTVGEIPEPNQVLFCHRKTTRTEIELLIERCLGAFQFHKRRKLFCIANVELLSNELQSVLIEALGRLQGKDYYHFAIICRASESHPVLEALRENTMQVAQFPEGLISKMFQTVLPNVVTITSEVPGLGKTCIIQRLAHKRNLKVSTLHISGPVKKRTLVKRIIDLQVKHKHLLHIDIGNVDKAQELDTFLFELIVLGYVAAGTMGISLCTSHVAIEIANTVRNDLRNKLQTTMLFRREHLEWKDYEDLIVSRETCSPIQVVCHYLSALDVNEIDRKDIYFSGARSTKPLAKANCQRLLRKNFTLSADMSFTLLHIFLNFFADQLKKLSSSTFFRTQTLTDMLGAKELPTVRSALVTELLKVSIDFAARSVHSCKSTQMATLTSDDVSQDTKPTSIGESAALRLSGMIRWDDSNHLMYVFHNQDIQTLSAMYRDVSKVPKHVVKLFESQMGKKDALPDYKTMDQSELQQKLAHVARSNPVPLKKDQLYEMAKRYALTPDNLLKMVLIMLRVKANIPVIIMGETGCGKTSLIRYLANMCGVEFIVVSIHAGVSETDIVDKILQTHSQARSRLHVDYWLFLDEINTSSHIGIISDAICHHKCLGTTLSTNLVLMAACNPYRLKTESSILKCGLQGKLQTDELSRLVYRVLPLPEMIVDYVWDFGSLSERDEEAYIRRIVHDVFTIDRRVRLLGDMIVMSQRFVRDQEGTSSCVSLRDVQRCRKLVNWFLKTFRQRKMKNQSQSVIKDETITAIVMTMAHCYQSRFADIEVRNKYLVSMATVFAAHTLPYNDRMINREIKAQQNDFLDRMELPKGTARNVALQENVFVILVSILNKIPIFVVGKPGCSKSLSMQVIRSNLRGKDSKDGFFKTLPQLYCVAFQGSESSTSDGIIKVFEKAENYQKMNSADEVLSVVILDEIGLAEISGFNPLKVLHSLLESDTDSGPGVCATGPKVAVVGISNWALDASKMNRAVHLSRPEMNIEELVETGISISRSFVESYQVQPEGKIAKLLGQGTSSILNTLLGKDIQEIACAYLRYTSNQMHENFHGLRDYYSLVKFIARTLQEIKDSVTKEQKQKVILEGLQRNFGGLPQDISSLLGRFKLSIDQLQVDPLPVTSLIRGSLNDTEARHLMLITTSDAAQGILENVLVDMDRESTFISGSHFEEDLSDDYSYRILSKIILCMEQGIVLVLKDLDSIYGSLYDMLNQSYTVIGTKRHCRVALGQYSNPICQVHKDFKCVVLARESKIDHSDPPFLNRFEKQFLRFADILTQEDKSIIDEINGWIAKLVSVRGKHFSEKDVFPIHSKDMVPSLVLRATKAKDNAQRHEVVETCKRHLISITQPEAIVRLASTVTIDDETWENETKEIARLFFDLPIHKGLKHFLGDNHGGNSRSRSYITVIFTNSNIHTKFDISGLRCQIEKLSSFQSEKQLSTKLQQFWDNLESEFLFIQCSAVDDEEHILLAKSTVERLRYEYLKTESKTPKHVCLLIHMDRNRISQITVPQIHFLSEWTLVTLDRLDVHGECLLDYCSDCLHDFILKRRPLYDHIREQLFWAITQIKYQPNGRSVENISHILRQMEQSTEFLAVLDEAVVSWIKQNESMLSDNTWQLNVACDVHALYASSSLINALEQHVRQVINKPLAMMFFELEKANVIDTFFVSDSKTSVRRETWWRMVNDSSIVNIEKTAEPTGPECYQCMNPAFAFRFPFSYVIYNAVEETREEFMGSLRMFTASRSTECGEEPGGDDDEAVAGLTDEDKSTLLLRQDVIVSQKIDHMLLYAYDGWEEDYVHDFCTMVSHSICQTLTSDQRIAVIKWALSQKLKFEKVELSFLIVLLHTTVWMHSSTFMSVLRLIEACVGDNHTSSVVASLIESPSAALDSTPTSLHPEPEVTLEDESAVETKDTVPATGALGGREDMTEDETFHSNASLSCEQNDRGSNETQFQELAMRVCAAMLPTSDVIQTEDDIQRWQLRTNNVLALASQVSVESTELHALRMCSDFMLTLRNTGTLDLPSLQTVAEVLKNGNQLDSETVFGCVRNIIQKSAGDTNPDILQALWRTYFDRCVGASIESNAVKYLFQLISEQELPTGDLAFLEQLIQLIITDDFDPDTYCSLFAECEAFPESSLLEYSDALFDGTELEGSRKQFIVLFSDVVGDIFEKELCRDDVLSSERTDVMDKVLKAHAATRENVITLRYAVAIAYCKSFISCFVSYLDNEKTATNFAVTFQTLNAILDKTQDNMTNHELQMFFLKRLAVGKSFRRLIQSCDGLKEHILFLNEMDWTPDYLLNGPAGSPLTTHAPQSVDYVETLNGDTDTATRLSLIPKLISLAKQSSEGMVGLHAVAIRMFYLRRATCSLDDSTNTLAGLILNEATEKKLDEDNLNLLSCFLGYGEKGFGVLELHVHEECPQMSVNIATFAASLFALLLADNKRQPKDMSAFAKYLFGPKAQHGFCLPGRVPDDVLIEEKCVPEATKDSSRDCSCNFHIIFNVKVSDIPHRCPVCRVPWKSTADANDEDSPSAMGPALCSASGTLHDSIVSSKVLEIMKLTCLLGSMALGYATKEEVLELPETKDTDGDVVSFLFTSITDIWKSLGQRLGIDDQGVGVFLQKVLFETRDIAITDKRSCESVSEKSLLEREFACKVDDLARNRFAAMHEHIQTHFELQHISDSSTEGAILEVDTDYKTDGIKSLFRLTNRASYEGLESELEIHGKGDKHPFLSMVLKQRSQLEMLKHILPILRWHLATVASANYIVKRRECAEMTVSQFIAKLQSKDQQELMRHRFKALGTSWECLRASGFPGAVDRIHLRSKLQECFLLDATCDISIVLKELVAIHNAFIDKSLAIAVSGGDTSLRFLKIDEHVAAVPNVTFTEVTNDSIIDFNWTDDYLQFSHCRLERGFGQQIVYDFEQIEKLLANDILHGKTFFCTKREIPHIVFVDELFKNYVGMVRELKTKLPQKPLPMDAKQSFLERTSSDASQVLDLLPQLDAMMSLMNKTRADLEEPLCHYSERWKNFFTRPIPSDLMNCSETVIRVCHIVSFHELLEEINADGLIEALDDVFRTKLDIDMKKHLQEIVGWSHGVAEMLNKALKLFVNRCLSQGDADHDETLVFYIRDPSFWPDNAISDGFVKVGGSSKMMGEILPDVFLIQHVYDTVHCLEDRIEEQKKREKRLTSAITSFDSKAKDTGVKPKKSRRRALHRKV